MKIPLALVKKGLEKSLFFKNPLFVLVKTPKMLRLSFLRKKQKKTILSTFKIFLEILAKPWLDKLRLLGPIRLLIIVYASQYTYS